MEDHQYIVVGVERGGTSIIARILLELGIEIPGEFHVPNYESVELADSFRKKDWGTFRYLVKQYENQFKEFVWKLPDSSKELKRVNKIFTNPAYIFVYRDIYAISSRKQLFTDAETTRSLKSILESYERILNFQKRIRAPMFNISYEKLLLDKKTSLLGLAEFCGKELCEDKLASLESIIEPNPLAYEQWCQYSLEKRKLKTRGFDGDIDLCSRDKITGWFVKKAGGEPVKVKVFINNQMVATASCESFRQDLVDLKISKTGMAGFSVILKSEFIHNGDVVKVIPEGLEFGVSKKFGSNLGEKSFHDASAGIA